LPFGATDGSVRKNLYTGRGVAVAEYPVYIMESHKLTGINYSSGTNTFTIDGEGMEYDAGDYIEVEGGAFIEYRQITTRTSETAGVVGVNFDKTVTSEDFYLRRFRIQELIPPRLTKVIASQGNFNILQGTEDITTLMSGNKEAVFEDSLLWSSIIANSYQNLLDNVANPLIIKPRFRFEASEFAAIDMLRKVYLEQYASSFVINRILQYRSDGLCFVELIRIN